MQLLHGEADGSTVLGVAALRVCVTCQPLAPGPQAPTPPARPLCIHMALDRSGSMQGEPINTAKQAVREFATNVAAAAGSLQLAALHLLNFNHEVKSRDLFGLTGAEIEAELSRIQAGGGTSFWHVLQQIGADIIAAPQNARHFVVFFTDGQDWGRSKPASQALELFQTSTALTDVSIHCLGFSASHDASFLASLTLAGSAQGSFQYLEDVSHISDCMDRVVQELEEYAELAASSRLNATLRLGTAGASGAAAAEQGSGQVTLSVTLTAKGQPWQVQRHEAASGAGGGMAVAADGKEGEEGVEAGVGCLLVFHGHVILQTADDVAAAQQTVALALSSEGGGWVELALSWRHAPLAEAASLALLLVKGRVIEWTSQLASGQLSRGELEALRDHSVAPRRRQLAEMQGRVREVLPFGREAYRDAKAQLLAAASLLNKLEGGVLAAALTGTLSNHHIASLNHQAYALVRSSALRKGLIKRVGHNLDLEEEVQTGVAAALEKLHLRCGDGGWLSGLEGLPPAQEYGVCALSCMDWREALQAGDCLCLGLHIERPEAAIMDPSRLIIKAITPTRITAESFTDALNYSLGQRSAEEVHGGFAVGVEARVVAGEAREAVTGALPLWICDEHWSVAALQAKPLLGWMVTLSPLGYVDEQLRVVPFLVLGRAMRDLDNLDGSQDGHKGTGGTGIEHTGPTAFHAWVAEQVLATCQAVYRSRRRRLLAGLLGEEAQEVVGQAGGELGSAASGRGGGARQARLQYLEGGPAARTVDVVPSTEVFLMHLLCALRSGDVALSPDDWRQLRLAVLEEELRRCQWEQPSAAAFLGVEIEQASAEVVGRWGAAHPEAAEDEGAAGSPAVLRELEEVTGKLAAEVVWEGQLAGLGGRPEAAAAERAYQRHVRTLVQLLTRVEGSSKHISGTSGGTASGAFSSGGVGQLWEPPGSLVAWLGPRSLAALLLQNGEGLKNADRRAYLAEGGRYVDPFADPEELLRRHWHEVVWAAVRAGMQGLRGTGYLREATCMAERFAGAASLEAAADAIQGWRLGRPYIVRLLLGTLRQPGTPLPTDKLRLLMTGVLGQRVLRGDKHAEHPSGSSGAACTDAIAGGGAEELAVSSAPGDHPASPAGGGSALAWVPSRKRVYAYMRAHHQHVPLEQALQLFGQCRGVDEAYLRMQYAAAWNPRSPLIRWRKGRADGMHGGSGSGPMPSEG